MQPTLKEEDMFKPQGILKAFLVLIAAAAILSTDTPARADDDRLAVRVQGEVRYLSGGIGIDEREQLAKLAIRERMNLKLVFAQRDGALLSAVPVTISDASGAVRLNVKADGPWLFARLPAGEYRFRAESGTRVQDGFVTVSDTGLTGVVVSFP